MITKRNIVLIYGFVSLFFCLFLNIGIFKDYAFTDTYEFIWFANKDSNFQDLFVQGGRFLYGILSQFVFGDLTHTISDLKWVRMFGLLGCVAFSIQIFKFLLSIRLKPLEAALFSLLILAIPSFSVFVFWSATFEVPIPLILSFYAGCLLLKTFNSDRINKKSYFLAVLLVVISLCLYQSASTCFVLPFVFYTVIKKEFSLLNTIRLILFIGISFSLYYVIFKLSLVWYNLSPLDRADVDIIKLPLKVGLFYLREMRMLLYGSGLLIMPIVSLCIGLISFLGFFYLKHKKQITNNYQLRHSAFLLGVLPLSYLPNLMSVDNFISTRAIAPAAIIILFYQFMFFKELSSNLKRVKYLSIAIAVFFISISFFNVNIYASGTQHREYLVLKNTFENIPLKKDTKKIILIIPKHDYLQNLENYKLGYSDEFGEISASRPEVPEPMLKQILTEKALLESNLNIELISNLSIEVYNEGDSYIEQSGAIVINIIDILQEEFNK